MPKSPTPATATGLPAITRRRFVAKAASAVPAATISAGNMPPPVNNPVTTHELGDVKKLLNSFLNEARVYDADERHFVMTVLFDPRETDRRILDTLKLSDWQQRLSI